jgi:hypothetical protein
MNATINLLVLFRSSGQPFCPATFLAFGPHRPEGRRRGRGNRHGPFKVEFRGGRERPEQGEAGRHEGEQ